uniref:Uncharacterized protein n=1 Tax=Odontella aurita TaxID=265563 RepID=A0A7S4I087_9STRA
MRSDKNDGVDFRARISPATSWADVWIFSASTRGRSPAGSREGSASRHGEQRQHKRASHSLSAEPLSYFVDYWHMALSFLRSGLALFTLACDTVVAVVLALAARLRQRQSL